jgi:hypothetical protein
MELTENDEHSQYRELILRWHDMQPHSWQIAGPERHSYPLMAKADLRAHLLDENPTKTMANEGQRPVDCLPSFCQYHSNPGS